MFQVRYRFCKNTNKMIQNNSSICFPSNFSSNFDVEIKSEDRYTLVVDTYRPIVPHDFLDGRIFYEIK